MKEIDNVGSMYTTGLDEEDKNVTKRLRKLMFKGKEKPTLDQKLIKKHIAKHKKALEILKKYDES